MILKKLKKILKRKPKKTVGIIRLSGVIGKVSFSQGLTLNSLKYLEKISKTKGLKALALIINSPGGSPVQSELIARKIQNIAKDYKGKLPIIAFCEDVAASGGYWLACGAEEIIASKSSVVGSIGVISQGFGFVDAIKKIGVERRVITQGNNKSVLDPFSDVKKQDLQIVTDIQKDIHQSFIDHVKKSRGKRLKGKESEIFSGKFWSGLEAKKLGLIDDIGFYEEYFKNKFGKNVVFKEFSPARSFLQKKFSSLIEMFAGEIENRISFNFWR